MPGTSSDMYPGKIMGEGILGRVGEGGSGLVPDSPMERSAVG